MKPSLDVLQVAAPGISERTRNSLMLFFSRHCSGEYELSERDDAPITLLDADNPNGRERWQDMKTEHPNRPVILLSIKEHKIDGALVVHKPIRSEPLKHALNECRHRLLTHASPPVLSRNPHADRKPSAPASRPKPVSVQKQPKALRTRNATQQIEVQHQSIHELCGNRTDMPEDIEDWSPAWIDPKRRLLSLTQRVMQQIHEEKRDLCVTIPGWKPILFKYDSRQVHFSFSDQTLRGLTRVPIPCERVQISAAADLAQLQQDGLLESVQSFDNILWKLTLWTTHGRLLHGTDPNQPVTLHHWPNFTRLPHVPAFLRISALWSREKVSLLETAKRLSLPQRVVFSFYNACHALAAVEHTGPQPSRKAPARKTQEASKMVPPRRSLLGRILARLQN